MIHEFAVDPELLVEWSESRLSFALFTSSFGLGEPRIMSRYPVDWKELAKKCWDEREAGATTDEEKGKLELQRERFIELSRLLSEAVVDRTKLVYVYSKTWLDNAKAHAPRSIPSILTRRATGASAHVLVGEGIVDHPRWKLQKAMCVARDAKALGEAVAPLLRCSDKIVFVDPYFDPTRSDYRHSFEMFVKALESRVGLSNPSRIAVLTSVLDDKRPSWSHIKTACEKYIWPLLPVGWEMTFVAVSDSGPQGEKFHNRYILTNLGGIVFGVGLDSGEATQADDLSVMGRAQYEKRWEQYAGLSPEFKVDGTNQLTLKGVAKVAAKPPHTVPGRSGRR